MNRLFTGGNGLLGKEIKTYFPSASFPLHKEFDVSDYYQMDTYLTSKNIDLIIHMAAATDTRGIENDINKKLNAIETNIIGTANLVQLCIKHDIKLIYISTDYVFKGDKGYYVENDDLNPVNQYAWSKLGGECAVRLYENSLIIRTSFCANEFPYDKAFDDQYTSRLSVKQAGEMIAKEIVHNKKGIKHIVGPRQTVYELANQLSPHKKIEPISIMSLGDYTLPSDTSLSTLY